MAAQIFRLYHCIVLFTTFTLL